MGDVIQAFREVTCSVCGAKARAAIPNPAKARGMVDAAPDVSPAKAATAVLDLLTSLPAARPRRGRCAWGRTGVARARSSREVPVGDADQPMSREERDRILSAAGSERWKLDLVQRYTDRSGKPREERCTRIVYLTARAADRWWWKVDDGKGSATLHYATRERESSTQALHDAQREVLFCNTGCAIVRVAKMKEGACG